MFLKQGRVWGTDNTNAELHSKVIINWPKTEFAGTHFSA